MLKKLLEVLTKKEMQKTFKKKVFKINLEWKKELKEKVTSSTLNGKDMTIHLIVGLIKETLYKNESILS